MNTCSLNFMFCRLILVASPETQITRPRYTEPSHPLQPLSSRHLVAPRPDVKTDGLVGTPHNHIFSQDFLSSLKKQNTGQLCSVFSRHPGGKLIRAVSHSTTSLEPDLSPNLFDLLGIIRNRICHITWRFRMYKTTTTLTGCKT